MARTKRRELPSKYTIGFLATMDKRTELYERLSSTYASIVDDLGGYESIATTKLALVERFVWLQEILRSLELEMTQSGDAKRTAEILAKWVQACNALQGIARAVGLEIQGPKAPVTLEAYVWKRRASRRRFQEVGEQRGISLLRGILLSFEGRAKHAIRNSFLQRYCPVRRPS